jgi:hypothetical protein
MPVFAPSYEAALTEGSGMDAAAVTRNCDELHVCVDHGPGEMPETFARALSAVRRLRADASWGYPIIILAEIETELARWFSPDKWRGSNDGHMAREKLLTQIARLEDAWEQLSV